jgi:hypothetical protein
MPKQTKIEKLLVLKKKLEHEYLQCQAELELEFVKIKTKIEEAAPEPWYAQVSANVVFADATKGRLIRYKRTHSGWTWDYLNKEIPDELIGWHAKILTILKNA